MTEKPGTGPPKGVQETPHNEPYKAPEGGEVPTLENVKALFQPPEGLDSETTKMLERAAEEIIRYLRAPTKAATKAVAQSKERATIQESVKQDFIREKQNGIEALELLDVFCTQLRQDPEVGISIGMETVWRFKNDEKGTVEERKGLKLTVTPTDGSKNLGAIEKTDVTSAEIVIRESVEGSPAQINFRFLYGQKELRSLRVDLVQDREEVHVDAIVGNMRRAYQYDRTGRKHQRVEALCGKKAQINFAVLQRVFAVNLARTTLLTEIADFEVLEETTRDGIQLVAQEAHGQDLKNGIRYLLRAQRDLGIPKKSATEIRDYLAEKEKQRREESTEKEGQEAWNAALSVIKETQINGAHMVPKESMSYLKGGLKECGASIPKGLNVGEVTLLWLLDLPIESESVGRANGLGEKMSGVCELLPAIDPNQISIAELAEEIKIAIANLESEAIRIAEKGGQSDVEIPQEVRDGLVRLGAVRFMLG